MNMNVQCKIANLLVTTLRLTIKVSFVKHLFKNSVIERLLELLSQTI